MIDLSGPPLLLYVGFPMAMVGTVQSPEGTMLLPDGDSLNFAVDSGLVQHHIFAGRVIGLRGLTACETNAVMSGLFQGNLVRVSFQVTVVNPPSPSWPDGFQNKN